VLQDQINAITDAEHRCDLERIASGHGLHLLPGTNQPPVHRVGGQETEDHSDLHHEPELDHINAQGHADQAAEDVDRRNAMKPYMPTCQAVSDSVSALMAATKPGQNESPRIGAMVKSWKTLPKA
jgi:hypothetical protein